MQVSLVTLLCAALAPLCLAQTAQITGRVTDRTGGVIPGTVITSMNVATGSERRVTANEVGYYTIPQLPPGEYRIKVEYAGFKPINRSGITLEVDQRAEINFVLEVGGVTEQIEVVADTVQLNTVDGSQGQVIENQRIVDMPLNGRDYNQLALLSAGAVQPLQGSRYGGFSSGGQRITQNNFVLDGLDNNGAELAGAQRRSEMVQPSIDAIQEFKVQTNSYAAEYGRAMGSVVNVTTKSGTNEFHGTAFEFVRNENLDAKNFFDPPDKPKPPFKRNQFGFSVGGPVLVPRLFDGRNKVFFFGDYEGTRIRESNTATSTIPTLLMRQGDFSELLDQTGKAIIDPITGSPFSGNIIPASRLDPLALKLIDLYPQPQNSSVAANFVYQSPRRQDIDKWDIRTDFNIGAKDTVYWRFSKHDLVAPVSLTLPPPAYGGGYDWETSGMNTGASWTRILTSNLVMSIRGGWNYGLFIRDNPAQTNGELLNEKYGIKGGNNTLPGGFSLMNMSGYANVGIGGFNPVDRDSQNRQIAGDLTWIQGKHTVKVGASILRSQNNIFNIRNEVGNYTFNARYTRDGIADFLLGMSSQWAWASRIDVNLRQWLHGFYVQDDWKVTPRFTLNLGLRYELLLPWIDTRDRMGTFDIDTDPDNPRLIYAGSEGSDYFNRAMYALDKNNFMPRFGFAYKLTPKTVVRAGYGIFYSYMEPGGDAEYLIGNPPAAYAVTLGSSARVPAAWLGAGPPEGSTELEKATGLTFSSYERHPKLGSAQQWNLNIQQELGRDWLLEVGYSGSHGIHLFRRYDGNFSPPAPGGINEKRRYKSAEIPGTGIISSPLGQVLYNVQDGNSVYHALVTRLEKRFSRGFTLLTSYSFSKSIGDTCGNAAAGNTTGCGFQDLRNLALERAVDNQDVPHRLVVSSIYDLPFGRGRTWGAGMPAVLNAIVGGWSIGSIVSYASGRPYSITVQGNPANTGSVGVVNRPNVSGDPYAITRTLEKDFDTSVFTPNAQYTIGNLGRNTMRERSEFNWDFSALKNFRIVEGVSLQFRFEAFHFTNTPRFGIPGNVVGTSNFGRITGAGDPRNLQFGLKLIW